MSDQVWLALIASVPPTLGTIGAIIIGLRNGRIGKANIVKSDLISDKADVIVGHVNSAQSALTAKAEGLQSQVTQMHETIATQTQAAALLAQAVIEKDKP